MTPEQIEAVQARVIVVRHSVITFGGIVQAKLHEQVADDLDHLTKANEELRAEVEEQARLNGMGAEHELSLRATIDRLTKERDEALAEADPELLTIAWMDGSHRSAKAARDEIKRLTTRLSAMQEAIDEAVRRADRANAEVMPCTIEDVAAVLRPFATQPEPDMCPVCSGDCAGANPPVIFCPMQDRILTKPEVDPLVEALREVLPTHNREVSKLWAANLRTALAARGGRVVFDGREG